MFKNELLDTNEGSSDLPIFYIGSEENVFAKSEHFICSITLKNADLKLELDGFRYLGNPEVLLACDSAINVEENVQFFRQIRRNQYFSNTLDNAKKCISEDFYFSLYIAYRELIYDFYHQHVSSNFFQEIIKSPVLKTIADFKILTLEEVRLQNITEDVIFLGSDFSILMHLKDDRIENLNSLSILSLCLYEFFKDEKEKKIKNIEVTAEFNLILDELIHPTVVLGIKGDILFFNEEFSKLSLLPSQISEFNEGEWFEFNKCFFQIKKSFIEDVGSIFVFYNSSDNSQVFIDHKKELGIITGSIAHELNNPVAGILAAISVLELEEWNIENSKLLIDLKESAIRCKELIDTFLGFSKYGSTGQSTRNFESIIGQSISLLRFRMIESGLKLNVELEEDIKDEKFNSAMFSMVLYLILGELITIFSHQKLINSKLSKTLTILVSGELKRIRIGLAEISLSDSEMLKLNQKLIHHLLEMDSMSLKSDSRAIYINF